MHRGGSKLEDNTISRLLLILIRNHNELIHVEIATVPFVL